MVGPSSSLSSTILASFTEWSADECPYSHELPKPLSTHLAIYDNLVFTESNALWTASSGMSVPMVVTISVPTSSSNYIEPTIAVYKNILQFAVSYSGDTTTCEQYEVDVSVTGVDDYTADNTPRIRYVVNHLAEQGTHTLLDWETDVATTHTSYLSADGSTWDRYLDSHIGLFNYANDDSTTECTTEVDTVIAGMDKYDVMSGPREEMASLHWYAGVRGLASLELNMGCAADYSNVCGCIAANNDVEYLDEFGYSCY